ATAADNDSLKAQLVRDWQRAKAYTAACLEKMPADKFGYRPADSIRSFAEQMLHLAQGNIGLVSNGIGKDRLFAGRNLERSAGAQSKDSVIYYVMASYDYCIDGIKGMDAARLDEPVKRGAFTETRLSWILKGFEHQGHHRGQCTIYIRMLGITPPNEMLF
ncbi:MAG TPA: DinB family protein, partial [Flavisolibacter sp.]|nr:DinB family protein [Flavisolibacter sp.]